MNANREVILESRVCPACTMLQVSRKQFSQKQGLDDSYPASVRILMAVVTVAFPQALVAPILILIQSIAWRLEFSGPGTRGH
jgi:hypothetical protein